jgi:Ca2+-binding EF-hand superfamily protein
MLTSPRQGGFSPRAQSARPVSARYPGTRETPQDYCRHLVSTFTNDEKIVAARQRMMENRQRAQLKEYMKVSARFHGSHEYFPKKDLGLMEQLTGLAVPAPAVQKIMISPRGRGPACPVSGETVSWRELDRVMSPRSVKRPEPAHITALKEKRAAQEARKQARATAAARAAQAKVVASRPKVYNPFAGVDLQRLQREHAMLRKQWLTRFIEIRRGFRLLDEDRSGTLDHNELRNVLRLFNLETVVSPQTMNCLIAIADYDGSGVVNFAEWSRIVAAEDILKIKDTLSNNPVGNDRVESCQGFSVIEMALPPKPKRHGPAMLRNGVVPHQLRQAQSALKQRITDKYAKLTDAFKAADDDNSGTIDRDELMDLLNEFNMGGAIKPAVLDNLIDFADTDGDGVIDQKEFAKVMNAKDIFSADKKCPNELSSALFVQRK